MSGSSLTGALGLLVLYWGLLFGSWGVLLGLHRLFGVAGFAWFSIVPAQGGVLQRVLARLLSSSLPLLVGWSLLVGSLLRTGLPVATTKVDVLPGPARDAGMLDGDRIVAMRGTPVRDFDEIRASVAAQQGPLTIELERDGVRQELEVTPVGGRVGVVAVYDSRPVGFGEALRAALPVPLKMLEAWLAVFTARERAELRGPVGIVAEVSKSRQQGSMLHLLGLLALQLWPAVVGMHAFELVTRWLFRLSHPGADAAEAYALARLYQAHLVALVGFAAAMLVKALEPLSGPAAAGFAALALSSTLASFPLIWVTGLRFWPRRKATWMLLLSTCLSPFMSMYFRGRLADRLEQQGFRVSLWRATPASTTT